MFENLSDNLNKIFSRLKGKGFLSEDDVNAAMREVRVALLEADVALPVVKEFINKVKERAIGQEVMKSISPAQMVIKIVQDNLAETVGSEAAELNLNVPVPAVIMMAGLQGSGKTTSAAKLALHLRRKKGKRVLLASLDVYRPAAQKQLEILAMQIGAGSLPIIDGEKPEKITMRALEAARLEGYDVLILDTAGRLHIDAGLMRELQVVKKLANPVETLLVADCLTGQDAVNIAGQFQSQIGITGIILTRVDGDGRGGAALSMRRVTGCAIKFIGVGEKVSEFEEFHPSRIASRILGMGDIVALVESAAESIDMEEAKKLQQKMKKGSFDLDDLAKQFKTMRKMGGIGSLMGMLPGVGKIKKQLDAAGGIDEKMLVRQESIIYSMTTKERRYPNLLNGSRKRRIALGAGVEVQEVNRLLKQFKGMETMMKKLGKMNKKSIMRGGMRGLMGG